jgi:hypothetical protein
MVEWKTLQKEGYLSEQDDTARKIANRELIYFGQFVRDYSQMFVEELAGAIR